MYRILLPFQALRRDLRAGELTLLLVALLLAVASLTSVAFFTDRLGRAVDRDANQLLGGDLLLVADHPVPDVLRGEARRRGLREAQTWLFSSMVTAGEQAQLAGVKAASQTYPLRGRLEISPAIGIPGKPVAHGPAAGEVWLDERLAGGLDAKVGDSVGVGRLQLRVGAVLSFEPDRGNAFFAFAPRLMMNLADVAASELVQVGSRVTYRVHFAGPEEAVRGFETWLQPRLGRGESVESINNARPELRDMLDRAHRMLSLAALLAVVLSAVAVGLATRRFVQRHLDGCAAMRCFGATQNTLLNLFLGEFLLLGLLAAVLGAIAGLGIHLGIAASVASLIDTPLPPPSFAPALQGAFASLVLLIGFALPQLLRLGKVPTIRVLRREWPAWEPAGWVAWTIALVALGGLMLWVARDLKLGLWVMSGFAAALLLYGLIARLAIGALARLRAVPGSAGGGWRYGLASLGRRAAGATVQAVALAMGLTAMLLLSVGHHDLISGWRAKLPADAPNRFIVNIQQDQLTPLREFFSDRGLEAPRLLPMIRGRLTTINGHPVKTGDFEPGQAQRLAEREFNLSRASLLQAGNRVVAGKWHGQTTRPEFSVEQGIAKSLGLKLGDRLGFDVAGSPVEARVTSLRALDWDSMRVNFFVIASPGVLDQQPASYVTSFHLPAGERSFAPALARAFPNLTLIDVSEIMRQLQNTLDTLTRAVQLVFGLALAAGIVVMASALQATHDERAHEIAILRTLGARDTQLRAALLAEFAALGLVAGLMGAVGAGAIAAVVALQVFQFPFNPSLTGFGLGALVGMAGVVLAGWGGTRRLLGVPPLLSLRALA